MKIYAVSCSPERMERLRARAAPLNLDITTIESPFMTDPEVVRRGDTLLKKDLGYPGGVAATIGHIRAMQRMIHDGEEFGLIIEDDVRFHKNFNQYIPSIEAYMKSAPDIDVFLVGYCSLCAVCEHCHGWWNTRDPHAMMYHKTCRYCNSKARMLECGIQYFSHKIPGTGVGNPYGAQGYVISRRFAKHFVKLFEADDIHSVYPRFFVTDQTIFDPKDPIFCRTDMLRIPIIIEDPTEQTLASNTNKPPMDCIIEFSNFYM